MKKILIISDVWHPQVNGVLTIFNNLIPLLEQKDFEVKIIHPGLFRTFPLPFYPEIRIPIVTKKTIESIIEKEDPDYIHIPTESVLGFLARSACKRKKLKFTTSFHTDFPLYIEVRIGFMSKSIYKYLKWFHSAGARTMVPSFSLKSKLEKKGFSNLHIWPGGVNTNLFRIKEKKEVPFMKKPIFVYLGRIAIEKNLEEFLKCSLPGTKLIIGDGPLRKTLEKKYTKDVSFVGYKREEELVDLLSSCDVFVFPSYTDTFGLTIVEAMACGLPTAAHDVVGPTDIITQGMDGFLDKNLEIAAMKCLNLSKEACRKKSLLYSWEASTQEFIKNLSPLLV